MQQETQQQQTICVVDDEVDIREPLREHLERAGFRALAAANAAAARDLLKTEPVDLMIVDIMMPGEDGLSLCRSLRETHQVAVILLTALTDDTDKIVGLEVGADDYVSKPFNPRELVARVRAVLRRTRTGAPTANKPTNRFAHWTLNEPQSELTRDDGLVVYLSAGELSILKALLAHPGEVLSRDDLTRASRGRDALALERTVDNAIARLRKKIERNPASPRIIKTVRGGGYRLIIDHDAP
ncbi:MAG: response regulator [Pseudomonadota bacterium]